MVLFVLRFSLISNQNLLSFSLSLLSFQSFHSQQLHLRQIPNLLFTFPTITSMLIPRSLSWTWIISIINLLFLYLLFLPVSICCLLLVQSPLIVYFTLLVTLPSSQLALSLLHLDYLSCYCTVSLTYVYHIFDVYIVLWVHSFGSFYCVAFGFCVPRLLLLIIPTHKSTTVIHILLL